MAPWVRYLVEDHEGRLILVADGGVTRLDAATGQVVDTWRPDEGLADALPAVAHVDAGGVVWIGHRSGRLLRLAQDQVFVYGKEHGLTSQSITGIVEDRAGDFWLGGRRGILRVSRDELDSVAAGNLKQVRVREFRASDGLREARIPGGFQPPAVLDRDGRVWFTTMSGAVVVDPARVPPVPTGLGVVIDEIRADGRRLQITDSVRVPAATQTLEIDYTVPRQSDGELLRFRYRMRGATERWQDAGARRTAFFTSLPPRANVIARYGGEEFVILLTGSDVEATRQIGQRIQRSVRNLNMPHPGRPPGSVVTVSAGFATAEPGIIDSAVELLKRADDALYRAKEFGRDRVFLARDLAASG